MPRRLLFAVLLLPIILRLPHQVAGQPAAANDYLVVSLLEAGDAYEKAAKELVRLRSAKGVRASSDDLNALLPKLKRYRPTNVAFVARPEQVDVNLARQLFKLSTRVDDDPFVDFSYGIITGATPEVAVRLAKSGCQIEAKRRKPDLGILGVADGNMLKESISQEQMIPLSGAALPMTWATVANKEGVGDQSFIDKTLDRFQSKTLFAFAGHGYPDGVVGGPKHGDIKGSKFDGAIVYNIACYTGVTCNWYKSNHQSSKVELQQVKNNESFCLSILEAGVANYVAYACPRPAGPEMFADMLSLATEGISIGEQRRRQANAVILTHLSQDFDELGYEDLADGQDVSKPQSTDEIVRNMSTGGLLFGDPATVPFRKTRDAFPVSTRLKKEGNDLQVDVSIQGPLWHWFCSDQLEQTSMKIEARVPVGSVAVNGLDSVTIDGAPFGSKNPMNKISAAIETHGGETFLNLKATFDRPAPTELARFSQGVSARFMVKTSESNGPDRFLHLASGQ